MLTLGYELYGANKFNGNNFGQQESKRLFLCFPCVVSWIDFSRYFIQIQRLPNTTNDLQVNPLFHNWTIGLPNDFCGCIMECLFHLQNNDFECRANYGHQNHFAKRNDDMSFALGQSIMLVQNFNGIELVLLNNLDCQGVYNARICLKLTNLERWKIR